MTRSQSPRALIALVALLAANACGPKVAPQLSPTAPPVTAYEQKLRWILQLEDERQLTGGGGDLLALLQDSESRVRRRAALAAGRVRLPDAIPGLTTLLAGDKDVEVRQMAAFALGLIGDVSAASPLTTALADSDPTIQGRAAEALGLIAHKPAAPVIGAMVAAHVAAGALNGMNADDMGMPKPPPVEAVRLGIYALVRLGSYDDLAAAVLDRDGQPRSRWWPVAFALQRINDARAVPALLTLLSGEGQLSRAFAARGLGVLKDQRATAPLLAIADNASEALAVRIQAVRGLALLGDARGGPVLMRLITSPQVNQNLQLEAIVALGQLRHANAVDLLIDLVPASWPSVRAAALQALARTDADTFMSAISALDPDANWSVRAAMASAIGELGGERAEAPLTNLLRDADQRVIPAVLDALAKAGVTSAVPELLARLKADDQVVRAAAARAGHPEGAWLGCGTHRSACPLATRWAVCGAGGGIGRPHGDRSGGGSAAVGGGPWRQGLGGAAARRRALAEARPRRRPVRYAAVATADCSRAGGDRRAGVAAVLAVGVHRHQPGHHPV